jgi:cytochrome c oxidase cbb3-type subunit III
MRIALVVVLSAAQLGVGCEREARQFENPPAASAAAQNPMQTPLSPGAQPQPTPEDSPFQKNAYGIAEGKRLFTALNCAGCHANGGGGMGPALMDDEWIYGNHPANLFQTVVEGRPNGMPSWRGKIPDHQVWQLVAYIQSMSGQAPLDALPGRADHMSYGTPENARSAQTPVQTGRP